MRSFGTRFFPRYQEKSLNTIHSKHLLSGSFWPDLWITWPWTDHSRHQQREGLLHNGPQGPLKCGHGGPEHKILKILRKELNFKPYRPHTAQLSQKGITTCCLKHSPHIHSGSAWESFVEWWKLVGSTLVSQQKEWCGFGAREDQQPGPPQEGPPGKRDDQDC